MKKLFVILIVVTSLILCTAYYLLTPDTKLEKSLEAKIFEQKQLIINLGELTDFEWDEVVIFTPYTSQENADRMLGFHWSGFGLTRIESSDWFNIIAFLNKEKIVKVESVSRRIDFNGKGLDAKIKRDKAIFSIAKNDYDAIILTLILD